MNLNRRKILVFIAGALVVPAFMWQQINFWNKNAKAEDSSLSSTTETTPRVDLQAVEDTQSSISDLQKKLDKEKKAKEKLQQNLGQIQQAVAATQSDINKTKSVIKETEQNITSKQQEIENLNQQIELQTQLLKSFIRQMYYTQEQPVLNSVLTKLSFSDLFSNTDHYLTLAEKIKKISEEIKEKKLQIEQDKTQLAGIKAEHEDILDDKLDQKQDLVADQIDTQQSIADKQKAISKLNQQLAELQSDLNSLLGKSYSAKNIMDAVEFASDKTGVPKGFLIGVLKMETNLGRNVGGCTYDQVESGAEANYKKGNLSKTAWNTFQNRREIFKDICSSLNYNYEKQKVSCNPSGYAGTGGAMGVAQFMPDTWQGYSSQVSSLTGHKNPDPWDLTDGVVAMASKLSRTPGVTDGKKTALKTAACSYLGTCYAPYVDGILYWADNYKDLIN